ncbi:UNC-like C-terminal-domain-containing protein [Rhizophagus diaphanus]|nr:UNC-like C-terminal-domain-containing protein [Rhizophagus diaphanus] [Rhizophagus sp. MUCL 43196]
MSPITRSKTIPIRYLYPDFPSFLNLEVAYNKALSRIQQDAKEMLEMVLDEHEVRVHLYSPNASPEYWLVNNNEALEEVVYYKMRTRLVNRYRQQFMNKGIDISKYEEPQQNVQELFSRDTLPVMDICGFAKEGYEKYSFFHEEEGASSSTAFYQQSPSPPSSRNFSFSFKFESSQTLLGDYTDTEIDDTRSSPLVHRHHGRTQFISNFLSVINFQLPNIQLPINLLRRESFYFLFIVIISFLMFGYMFELDLNKSTQVQLQKKVTRGRLNDTVRVQVQQFIEQEMSRVSTSPTIIGRKEYIGKEVDNNDGRLLGYVRTQLNEVLQEQLERMMEGTSTDYALYASGAKIIPRLTSRTYEIWPSKVIQRFWGKLTRRNVITSKKPEIVISPNINVGDCWCFNGTQGQIGIKLSRNIIVTHVTYSHIGKGVSIDPISSAPREFELWGLDEKKDFKISLGKYQYDLYGHPTQLFNVTDEIAKKNNKRVSSVLMRVLNNHENPKFTCLYRLQIHGIMPN